ncbi:hypothetical protein HDF18_02765 [Mucilaginibacter sp. X5P1]|uniref:hypothetical protein n=1 Tax=Mucilaginibacter sp. X5P1 TaxID=2723088 RepID=UPI00161A0314|nr:hypothetical protein [Mucilaginibacter sp. X5P1]MBB6137961.1 hypothetical protein [Mucilaginibacter sp. X5P1]
MILRKVISIDFRHDYFGLVTPELFEIFPTETCKSLMKQYGLRQGKGFPLVIYSNAPINSTLPKKISFDFLLQCKDQCFLTYTNFPPTTQEQLYLFTNKKGSDLQLSVAATKDFDLPGGASVFGAISINANVTAYAGFAINFQPIKLKWKYYIISAQPDMQAVVDGSFQSIAFEQNDKPQSDPVYTSLTTRFPNAGVAVFESEKEIPLSSRGLRNIKLKNPENNTTMISHLPNPRPGNGGITIINL